MKVLNRLYRKLFWKRVYRYRTVSRLEQVEDNERVVNVTATYQNSYPAGIKTSYLVERIIYVNQ